MLKVSFQFVLLGDSGRYFGNWGNALRENRTTLDLFLFLFFMSWPWGKGFYSTMPATMCYLTTDPKVTRPIDHELKSSKPGVKIRLFRDQWYSSAVQHLSDKQEVLSLITDVKKKIFFYFSFYKLTISGIWYSNGKLTHTYFNFITVCVYTK